MAVLAVAHSFAHQLDANLGVLTVEPRHSHEPAHLAAAVPDGRSVRLGSRVRAIAGLELEVRRGEPVAEIVDAVTEHRPDVLVIGCHRGGPPGIIDAGSTARRLAHTAPCTILTVPL
jgi:nucleotide-binding universal stress UspA family protein